MDGRRAAGTAGLGVQPDLLVGGRERPDDLEPALLAEHEPHLARGPETLGPGRMSATPIASRIAAVVADEEYELIGPLMESLATDLLAGETRAAQLLGVRLHSLDSAIEHALAEWEATEPLAAR